MTQLTVPAVHRIVVTFVLDCLRSPIVLEGLSKLGWKPHADAGWRDGHDTWEDKSLRSMTNGTKADA